MLNPAHRFHAAISVLCGHGELKQRIVTAYQDNLAQIEDKELPPNVRQSFAELRDLLSRVAPLNGEGAVRASVRKMSVKEADRCARMMAQLHFDIMSSAGASQEMLPLEVSERSAVAPPFLVKSH